jgi:sec-independent protein translocase protein TatB
MFGVGWSEILLILVVALLVLGPTKLPDIAKGLGKGLREFKRAMNSLEEDDPPPRRVTYAEPPPRPAEAPQPAPSPENPPARETPALAPPGSPPSVADAAARLHEEAEAVERTVSGPGPRNG